MARKSSQPPQATKILSKIVPVHLKVPSERQDHRIANQDVPELATEQLTRPQPSLEVCEPSKDESLEEPTALRSLSPDLENPSLPKPFDVKASTVPVDGARPIPGEAPKEAAAYLGIEDAPSAKVPSLAEVTRLLRVQEYQKRKCHQAQSQLHAIQFAAAKETRLTASVHSVRATLAECIRFEDKTSFANLHDAFQEACAAGQNHSNHSEADGSSSEDGLFAYPESFTDRLSHTSRMAILDFVAKIRSDGNFLADRLSALTHKELLAILPDKQKASSQESVFSGSTRGSSRLSKPLGYVVDSQLDQLASCGFASPLEALICAPRCLGAPDAQAHAREMDTWATVAAKLIIDQKPGSEKLVPALLNLWSSFRSWPGKDRLEQWISQTLQDGWFLLEQPNKQTFRMRVQGRPDGSAEDEARAEAYYTRAVNSLLDLLGDSSIASIIPDGAIAFAIAVSRHLASSPGHQRAFPHFLMTRWLFPTFFYEAITLPEAHGWLCEYYVSDLARQRILREVAVRAQKIVLDVAYTWKYGSTVSTDAANRVNAITRRFEALEAPQSRPVDQGNTSHTRLIAEPSMVALTASDMLGMVETLYPVRRPSSLSSDRDTLRSGVHSSASSVSGFSMFKGANGSDTTLNSFPNWSTDSFSSTWNQKGFTEPPPAPLNGERVAWEDEESQALRDACSDLEDAVGRTTGTAAQDLSQWTFLVEDTERGSFSTMRQTLHVAASVNQSGKSGADDVSIVTTSSQADSTAMLVCARTLEDLLLAHGVEESARDSELSGPGAESVRDLREILINTFEDAVEDCNLRSDFLTAHEWFDGMRNMEVILETSGVSSLVGMISDMEQRARWTTERASLLAAACSISIEASKVDINASRTAKALARREGNRLRDKMWYVADVRTSAAYDEVRCIAAALRVMGKPKRPTRTTMAPPLRHWTGPKLSSQNMHLKTESQILELLSAAPKHGGPNKLSDEQARSVLAWLEKERVHNFCQGEERLHKLCMELRKCVDILVPSHPTDSPVIASTVLFARERAALPSTPVPHRPARTPLFQTPGRFNDLTVQTSVPQSVDTTSSASRTLSGVSSRDYFDHRSPTLTTKSSATFWSPAVTDAQSPCSATSIASYPTHSVFPSSLHTKYATMGSNADLKGFEQLRQTTISLLLSDLGICMFAEGCETDRFFWQGLGGQLFDTHVADKRVPLTSDITASDRVARSTGDVRRKTFDYEDAFTRIIARFTASTDPYAKLGCLRDADALLELYTADQSASTHAADHHGTSLEHLFRFRSRDRTDTAKIVGFKTLFKKQHLRPAALFRDLQLIASLVPSSLLELDRQGKAFWHAGLAATELKNEARTIFVETADSIIAYHTSNRGHTRSSSAAQQQRDMAAFSTSIAPSRTSSAEEIARYSMADAGHLLQIAAKEGDAVAQRELATLYLTHPELMDHIVAPFAKAKEVFKEELESKWRKDQDPNRCDPATMCVAHHWMQLSSKGGDALAMEFLRQREEMERLP